MSKNYTYAKLAQLAYCNPGESNDSAFDRAKFMESDNAEAWMFFTPEATVISCRGTEPSQLKDITADLKFWRIVPAGTGEKIHSGFWSEAFSLFPKVIKNLPDDEKPIVLTGHSLGAALATLYADRISDPNSACYTFGSPRVGDRKLINKMNFTCYRFRNNNDIVTRVPPEWIGYTHKSDELFYFDVDGLPRRGFRRGFMFMQWLKGTYRGFMRDKTWDAFAEHSMGDYYNLCKRQLAEENASN